MAKNETPTRDHLDQWVRASSEENVNVEADQPVRPALDVQCIGQVKTCLDLVERVWPNSSFGTSTVPKQLGRFQIGRGGHAFVYLALDPMLDRYVALKIARPELMSIDQWRERFTREAKAVASLSHGNIVQVYDTGVDSGICWIASSFCSGPSLAEWSRITEKQASPHDVAEMCAQVADAVDYIHRRGFLHRDLKPSNILLEPSHRCEGSDDFNELYRLTPKVTDFGLAKSFQTLRQQTVTGTILGTPAYMAPEQAEGRLDDIGPATDVFAIGAVLYELLVGRLPFIGHTDRETLQAIIHGKAIPPRSVRSAVPAELNAICMKCLEQDPNSRYGTARELASDLRNFCSGLPVVARPAGPVSRILKWRRRRPMEALLCGTLIGLALASFAAVCLQWREARRQSVHARESFYNSHRAVREMHASVHESNQYEGPQFQTLKKNTAEIALKYYRRFQLRESDPSLLADIAGAYRDIGFAELASGSRTEAIDSYEKSLELWRQLTNLDPGQREYWYFLSSVQHSLAQLYLGEHRSDDANRMLESAMAIHQQQGHRDSNPSIVAVTLDTRRQIAAKEGHWEQAQAFAIDAVRLREADARRYPGNVHLRREVAAAYAAVGSVHEKFGNPRKAIQWCEKARAMQQDLVNHVPRVPFAASNLARTLKYLADAYQDLGRNREAETHLVASCKVMQVEVNASPDNLVFRRNLAQTYRSLGRLQTKLQHGDLALRSLERSREMFQSLLDQDPQSVMIRFQLAKLIADQGRAYCQAGDAKQAADQLSLSVRTAEPLIETDPENETVRTWLSSVNHDLQAVMMID